MTAKRGFDLLVAGITTVVTGPVMLVVSVAILVADGRPVLFGQERVGWHGQSFTMLKFRTMRATDDARQFEAGDSRRVTRLGAWLRATKVDELPQLLHVLRGEMSIVGPRPEVPRWVAEYPTRFRTILSVRPGITDPASIAYRHEDRLLAASSDPTATYRDEILPRKLDLYDAYVRDRSLRGDLVILLRTLGAVFTRQD